MLKKKIILTGDRPTGPLHLGHYVGSLKNRVALQEEATQYIMIADQQALTDNYHNPQKVRENVLEVALDYLACGIDPVESTIFIQSLIPQLPELTLYYLNLVTMESLKHNPTVKLEIEQKGMKDVPAGFMIYPVSQAADITAFKANCVPVGADQKPMIEQTKEIVDKFNRIYGKEVLVRPEALIPDVARLPGIDGKAKMSKSLGNSITLAEEEKQIKKKVNKMPTATRDPSDPGIVEGHLVFDYLDAFDPDQEDLAAFKAAYKKGGIGDGEVKKRLIQHLEELIGPMRERRYELAKDPDSVMDLLREGSKRARAVAAETLEEVRESMHLVY